MKKKGEKSLQMIFGLFILLIISLVVLSMFFKFVKKGTSGMEGVSDDYTKEAEKDNAIQECQNLCDSIGNDASKIEFCKTKFQIDWDEDGSLGGSAQYGQWWFCEEKVPCFVLVDDCQRKYDGNFCRKLLAEKTPKDYNSLYLDIEGDVPTDTQDYSDGCMLPDSITEEDIEKNIYPTLYNWKERFCFSTPYRDSIEESFICPEPEFESDSS